MLRHVATVNAAPWRTAPVNDTSAVGVADTARYQQLHSAGHIDMLSELIANHAEGWPETSDHWDEKNNAQIRAESLRRARAQNAKL